MVSAVAYWLRNKPGHFSAWQQKEIIMNATVQSMPSAAATTKPLWAAVGVLGIAVVAMGASLVYVQTRPADGHVALAAMAAPEIGRASCRERV